MRRCQPRNLCARAGSIEAAVGGPGGCPQSGQVPWEQKVGCEVPPTLEGLQYRFLGLSRCFCGAQAPICTRSVGGLGTPRWQSWLELPAKVGWGWGMGV